MFVSLFICPLYSCFHSNQNIRSKKEKDLLGKVQYFANQLEQYRFDSQNSLLAAKEVSDKKETQLQEEIKGLRVKVDELEGEYSKAKSLTDKLKTQRDDLETELNSFKERYAQDITEWENRFELEQNARKKEQEKNLQLLDQAKVAAKKREQEAITDGQEMAEKMREMYASHLADTEKQLSAMVKEVSGKEEYIEQLESERKSVSKLLKQSFGLVRTRVKAGVKRVLRSPSPSDDAPDATEASTTTSFNSEEESISN